MSVVSDFAGEDEEQMAATLFARAHNLLSSARVGVRGNTQKWMRWRMTREVLDGLVRSRVGRPRMHRTVNGWFLYGLPIIVNEQVGPAPWALTLEIAA